MSQDFKSGLKSLHLKLGNWKLFQVGLLGRILSQIVIQYFKFYFYRISSWIVTRISSCVANLNFK